jgi:hypothetical protein
MSISNALELVSESIEMSASPRLALRIGDAAAQNMGSEYDLNCMCQLSKNKDRRTLAWTMMMAIDKPD